MTRNHGRLSSDEAGLTLLELMFAAGVMAMALSLLFGSLISISVIGRVNQSRTEATAVLSSVLEEVRSIPFDDLQSYTPPLLHGPGESFLIELACYAPASDTGGEGTSESPGTGMQRLTFPLSSTFSAASLPNPLEIEVTVRWREPNERIFQARASTIRER
jgi:type II secretory pathway pseudopilin PulG